MYKVPQVKRGIRGKTKGKVDEVLIVGVPFSKVEEYCEDHEIIISSLAVYTRDLEHAILWLNEKGTAYERKEDQ